MTANEALPDGHIPVLRAGQTARICVEHHGVIRALLWLVVARDASLYTAFCLSRPMQSVELRSRLLSDGSTRFTWDELEPAAQDPAREKISFHASGRIISPIGRSIGVNLRQLVNRTLLCAYLPVTQMCGPKFDRIANVDLQFRVFLRTNAP